MKLRRWHTFIAALIIVFAVGLVVGVIPIQPQPTHAAGSVIRNTSSGEQIQFTCKIPYGLKSVTITGPNQHGNQSRWSWSQAWWVPFGPPSVTTNGWWWAGSVHVHRVAVNWIYGSGDEDYSVPYQYGNNVYNLYC